MEVPKDTIERRKQISKENSYTEHLKRQIATQADEIKRLREALSLASADFLGIAQIIYEESVNRALPFAATHQIKALSEISHARTSNALKPQESEVGNG